MSDGHASDSSFIPHTSPAWLAEHDAIPRSDEGTSVIGSDTQTRCPLLIWALAYVGTVAGSDALLRLAARATSTPWLAFPATVSFIAVCVSAAALEVLIARAWMCDWVERPRARFALYVLSFVVGIFVWSGVTTERDVPLWYRGVIIGLFVVPLVALTATHSTHRFGKELRLVARIPVIVLFMIIAALLFLAITNHM